MGDKDTREILFDLAGAMLSQSALEMIVNEANAPGAEKFVTITIKNIARQPPGHVPRLIVDYGDLIHRIVTEMDRRERKDEIYSKDCHFSRSASRHCVRRRRKSPNWRQ